MYSNVRSLGVTGVGGYQVSVEVYISNGLPGFDIVGLPDAAVKESREYKRKIVFLGFFMHFQQTLPHCFIHINSYLNLYVLFNYSLEKLSMVDNNRAVVALW